MNGKTSRPKKPAARKEASKSERRVGDEERRSGLDRRVFPRPEGRRRSDGRRSDDRV